MCVNANRLSDIFLSFFFYYSSLFFNTKYALSIWIGFYIFAEMRVGQLRLVSVPLQQQMAVWLI
jgi:hypothetical protein